MRYHRPITAGVHRMQIKSFELKNGAVDEVGRTFEGYASTFNNTDRVGDVIKPGAFTKTIDEGLRSKKIKILWQHYEPLGMPIEMREDSHGLFVKGRISRTRLGDEAIELMKDGVVDKLSIGFDIPNGKQDYDSNSRIRTIHEIKLHEFSLVTFPANEEAAITAVKSLEDRFTRLKSGGVTDFGSLLTEVENLKALISQEPGQPTPEDEQPPELSDLLKSLNDMGSFARNQLY